ncbi:MAG TPA: DUF4197 domain-containing protein [Williamwhitmania sp.]|nr:DUF4197 domain-containing protein [Williamwhitmania sp.]
MKRIVGILIAISLAGCAELSQLPLSQLPNVTSKPAALTNDEIIQGLKDALRVGAEHSSDIASRVDGFYKNPQLFIPFPEDAIKVKNTLEKIGMTKQVNDFVLSLNRAAEEAAKSAAPIFIQAIQNMTIQDALGILKGGDNAATSYLRDKTYDQLKLKFKPIVAQSINKVEVTKYWSPLVSAYNKTTFLSGNERVNPNLEEYITERAIDGLFKLIAKEEQSIRKDPAARVTDILKKVFANQ